MKKLNSSTDILNRMLVLVEAERTAGGKYDNWRDITGARYHYPNIYVNKVLTGTSFLYYRGIRTKTGRRKCPEYFGVGRIGIVSRDPEVPLDAPKRQWNWFCEIEEYVPFPRPVPWKRKDGTDLEDIARNLFGNGVRDISLAVFEEIVALAGVESDLMNVALPMRRSLPQAPAVQIIGTTADSLLVPCRTRTPSRNWLFKGQSQHSRKVLERAKEVVRLHLVGGDGGESSQSSSENTTPRSDAPGDLECKTSDNSRTAVVIKGTAAERFSR